MCVYIERDLYMITMFKLKAKLCITYLNTTDPPPHLQREQLSRERFCLSSPCPPFTWMRPSRRKAPLSLTAWQPAENACLLKCQLMSTQLQTQSLTQTSGT